MKGLSREVLVSKFFHNRFPQLINNFSSRVENFSKPARNLLQLFTNWRKVVERARQAEVRGLLFVGA